MQPFILIAGLVVAGTLLTVVVSACVAGGRSDDVMELILRQREQRTRYVSIEPMDPVHEPALFVAQEFADETSTLRIIA